MQPAQNIRKRSSKTLGGLPLVALAFGPDPEQGETRGHARGVIAIGDIATGWLAIGGAAKGYIAIGGVARGAVAVGGAAIGLIAIGGGALGVISLGGLAVGVLAIGGLAIGGIAIGGGAIGIVAMGAGATVSGTDGCLLSGVGRRPVGTYRPDAAGGPAPGRKGRLLPGAVRPAVRRAAAVRSRLDAADSHGYGGKLLQGGNRRGQSPSWPDW